MLYYGADALYSVMGSLAETYVDLDNNPHQKTPYQTVQLDTWIIQLCVRTVRPYGRTIRRCMRTVCRCMQTVRLGSLGFAQYVATRAHISVMQ